MQMNSYQFSRRYNLPVSTNKFSYEQRKLYNSECELYIPAIKLIDNLNEISLGKFPVIEEFDNGKIKSYCGLEHIYGFKTSSQHNDMSSWAWPRISESPWRDHQDPGSSPGWHVVWQKSIWIFDNHNHALYFFLDLYIHRTKPIHIIHIDQHSDLWKREWDIDIRQLHSETYRYHLTNFETHIGNFLRAFLTLLETSCTQIRSETKLLEFDIDEFISDYHIILDIDIDFWAPEMPNQQTNLTIEKTKKLLEYADTVTISTSPYFIEQKLAIEVVKNILT